MAGLFKKASIKAPTGAVIALSVVLLLLALAPFSTALAIHHDFSAADHDGHEHSDTDLCQWVQYHTGHSLVAHVPDTSSLFQPVERALPPVLVFYTLSVPDSLGSRAPPQS
jgi:hypothetical protein